MSVHLPDMTVRKVLLLFAILVGVYFCAIGVDTMDVDASQYASMSREMKASGSYLQVYDGGREYLDKPPFLFWISAVSMKIFGENNFAFKLPSILFALWSLFALYKFVRLFYDKRLAVLSSIILASCQAFFLVTNDIRTDTILMSWVITAIWQLAEWYKSRRVIHFLLGAAAIGGGMLAKGPIALLVPIFAFGSHILLKREFKLLFQPVYLLGLVVIALVLLPMSIGLYQQFDMHPEKTVNGVQNVSGLRFFYWTQSFGRITGESPWNNNATFFFQFQNLLWGMLPWTLFFVAGLCNEMIELVRNRFRIGERAEFIATGGFLLAYCSLGLSKYQLPHYIYVVLPFISLITAKMVYAIFWQKRLGFVARFIIPIQWIICFAMWLLPLVILLLAFPPDNIWPWVIPVIVSFCVVYVLRDRQVPKKLFVISLVLIMGLNVFLSLWFYPSLLQYQAGNNVGRYVAKQSIANDRFQQYKFDGNDWSLSFYSGRIVPVLQQMEELLPGNFVLTMEEGLSDIQQSGKPFEIAMEGLDFHVTTLTGKFLNKNTREAQCKKYFLVKLL